MKQDIEIECVDCKIYFTYTKGEQEFIQKLCDEGKIKQLNTPKRCVECRNKRKEKLSSKETAQSYY